MQISYFEDHPFFDAPLAGNYGGDGGTSSARRLDAQLDNALLGMGEKGFF